MFEFTPIMIWGLIITAIVIIIIIAYSLSTGFNNTKEVEAKLLDKANRSERKRKCPDDKTLMTKDVVNGIVIDKCPSCGSIFLDKNELDIIRKRSGDPTNFGYIIAFISSLLIK